MPTGGGATAEGGSNLAKRVAIVVLVGIFVACPVTVGSALGPGGKRWRKYKPAGGKNGKQNPTPKALTPTVTPFSLRLGCGIDAAGTGAIGTVRRSGSSFVVLHDGGEGSHHFVETLRQFECVQVDISERWDSRTFAKEKAGKRTAQAAQTKAVMGFLQSQVVPSDEQLGLAKSHDAAGYKREKWNNETAQDCPAGVARGVLVRARGKWICQLAEHLCHPLQPIYTIRTQLMRYALSNYPKSGHHQWNRSYMPPLIEYNIKTLSTAANHMIGRWVSTALEIKTLEACGLEPTFAHYEQISDDAEKAVATGVVVALERTSGLKLPQRTRVKARDKVVKIHSDHISKFASNFGEIYRHFRTTAYPTFAMVMANPESGQRWLVLNGEQRKS